MLTSPVVAWLENAWTRIRADHPDLPDVVFVVASGSDARHPGSLTRGHWAPMRWTVGEDNRHEVFLAGERFADGPEGVLCTLLHEAAHALGYARGIKNTSRGGRYHNARFKELAELLGLAVDRNAVQGWTVTTATPELLDSWSAELETLTPVLTGYRNHEAGIDLVGLLTGMLGGNGAPGGAGGANGAPAEPPKRRKSRVKIVCGCPEPRAAYIAPGVLELGDVFCGVCGDGFTPAD